MKFFQNKYTPLFLLMALACLFASINFSYGYFEDVDVLEIIKSAWKFPIQGYAPSRSWGFPLYEFFLYPTIQYFGLTGAKVESVVFYVLSGLVFFELLFYLTKNRMNSFLGALCFLVHPISIVTSSAIVATSQEIFLALLALYFFFRYFYEGRCLFLVGIALFCGFATATRQDYFMLFASFTVTLIFFRKLKWSALLLFVACYFLTAVGPYFLFYGAGHFNALSTQFMNNDKLILKFLRAILGYMAIFGLPVLFLTTLFIILKRPSLKNFKNWVTAHPAVFLFFSAMALYFFRFTMLPDKLEYVWVLFPIFVVVIFVSFQSKIPLLLFLLAIVLPNILQIHLFRRAGANNQLDIGFSPGAIVQSRSERLRNEYRFFGDYETTVAKVAREKFGCQKHLWYLADTPDNDYCIVVPEEMLRFWNLNRLPQGAEDRKLFEKKIIVFDFPDNRGWRQFIKFTPWKKLDSANFRLLSPQ